MANYGYAPPPPKKRMGCLSLIGLAVLVLFGICFLGGVLGALRRKPETSTQQEAVGSSVGSAPRPPTSKAATIEEKVAKTQASTLIRDYSANEIAADDAWKGRRLDVTGVVVDISKGPLGGMHIMLNDELSGVRVTLKRNQATIAATLSKGETVTFRGTVQGKIVLNVVLDGAEIVAR